MSNLSLGLQATRGFLWLSSVTVAAKVFNTFGQIALAWLLTPADFGLVAMAYAFAGMVTIMHQAGIRQVLVHRGKRCRFWVNPGFWLSFTIGVLASVILAMLAPLATFLYDNPRVAPLILVLALAAPLKTLWETPMALLQVQLRFRTIALVGILDNVGCMVLALLFAGFGLGALSFVLPLPIMALVTAGLLWYWTQPALKSTPDFRRWRYLLGNSLRLIVAAPLIAITVHGGSLILGFFHGETVAGIYFFALNLSVQVLILLSINLNNVMLPSLSLLNREPERQRQAFLRASRLLLIAVVPVCLILAVSAEPLIRLCFQKQWLPAVPVLQILSVAAALRAQATGNYALIQARGNFKLYVQVLALNGLGFVILVGIGSYYGEAIGAAWGVLMYSVLPGPLGMYIALYSTNGRFLEVWRTYWRPLAAGIAAAAVGLYLGGPGPGKMLTADILRWISLIFSSVGVYLLVMLVIARSDLQEGKRMLLTALR